MATPDMFVTLQQARDHIRSDSTDDSDDITLKIYGASAIVLDYLKSRKYLYIAEVDSNGDDVIDSAGYPVPAEDSNGEFTVRYSIQCATLLMIGFMDANRDGNLNNAFAQGYLPAPVTALLYPLRDPTLA